MQNVVLYNEQLERLILFGVRFFGYMALASLMVLVLYAKAPSRYDVRTVKTQRARRCVGALALAAWLFVAYVVMAEYSFGNYLQATNYWRTNGSLFNEAMGFWAARTFMFVPIFALIYFIYIELKPSPVTSKKLRTGEPFLTTYR